MKKLFILLFVPFLIVTAQDKSLEIKDPWIRPAAEGMNTALFFEVCNSSDVADTLFGVSSGLADVSEVHETYHKEGDMMGMRHIDNVVIPANDSLMFKPMDYHVMLIQLKNDMAIGDSGKVTLHFKNAGDIEVTGMVRDMPKMYMQKKKKMKH